MFIIRMYKLEIAAALMIKSQSYCTASNVSLFKIDDTGCCYTTVQFVKVTSCDLFFSLAWILDGELGMMKSALEQKGV